MSSESIAAGLRSGGGGVLNRSAAVYSSRTQAKLPLTASPALTSYSTFGLDGAQLRPFPEQKTDGMSAVLMHRFTVLAFCPCLFKSIFMHIFLQMHRKWGDWQRWPRRTNW